MATSAQRGRRASAGGAAPLRPEFDPRVAYRAVVLALGLFAAGLLFEELVQIVMLVTIALVLAVPLAASATWLRRFHIPRAIGAVLSLLAGAAVAALLLAFVVPTFVTQVNDFVTQLPSTVAHLERQINHLLGLRRGTTTKAVTQFVDRYTHHPAVLLGPLTTIGVSIATAVGAIVVVIISALYMAISPDPLVNGLARLFPLPAAPTSCAPWSGSASPGWPGCAASPWTCWCWAACCSSACRSSACSSPRASRSSRRC